MDDAILSCGGLLKHCLPAMPCTTLTVCTADPNDVDPAKPPHGIALPASRRREEVAAMNALGCHLEQLGLLDAIYRRDAATGQFLYPTLDALWCMPLSTDEVQRAALAAHLRRYTEDGSHDRPTLFLAPCGIGHHVDHILCTQTLLSLLPDTQNVLLYEDFPYVVDQGAHVGVADSAEKALVRLNVNGLERFSFDCDVDEKITLIDHYPTQIDAIFGSRKEMRPMLLKNAGEGRTAERFWRIRKN
jgi:LmbE family N-acetylglucosaminyl deacetylase